MIEELKSITQLLWGFPLLLFLIGTGILLSYRLRLLQVTKFLAAFKLLFRRNSEKEDGDISPFQSLMTALSATIGTGNLIGVSIAISIGGPGAIAWMWICAFFGIATKYSEALLAVKYRTHDSNGDICGGPMYYLEQVFKNRSLSIIYTVAAIAAVICIGPLVQANSIAKNLSSSFAVSETMTGVFLVICTGAVVLGGIKKIAFISSWIVPIMGVSYIIGAVYILIVNHAEVPAAIDLILNSATSGTAAVGGFAGASAVAALRAGFSRGIFSNGSGIGIDSIAAAAAQIKYPVEQALIAMLGTFIDTLVICTLTGVMLITTGVWAEPNLAPVAMVQTVFERFLPFNMGGGFIAISIFFFAYSTILGFSYYGEKCVEYLWHEKSIKPYRIVYSIMVFFGAIMAVDAVWYFSDIFIAIMVVPNLIGLIYLSGRIREFTNGYFSRVNATSA